MHLKLEAVLKIKKKIKLLLLEQHECSYIKQYGMLAEFNRFRTTTLLTHFNALNTIPSDGMVVMEQCVERFVEHRCGIVNLIKID